MHSHQQSTMCGRDLATQAHNAPAFASKNGENSQRWWQSQAQSLDRPALSEADPQRENHPQPHTGVSPNYSYGGFVGTNMNIPPAAENLAIPRYPTVQDTNVNGRHCPGHLRSGEQSSQSSPSQSACRQKGRTVLVQDVVIRLLIMSQLDTRHVEG
ncbi:hypothetical protein BJV74DRAFT_128820 [Russula compacta]|nr:hypothetical protein BJV74DRAFT_128820 [Russula compacta]